MAELGGGAGLLQGAPPRSGFRLLGHRGGADRDGGRAAQWGALLDRPTLPGGTLAVD